MSRLNAYDYGTYSSMTTGMPPIPTLPHSQEPSSELGELNPSTSRREPSGASSWFSYPAWLPKRPSPPRPQSTVRSSESPPQEEQQAQGRGPTPRSVRIISKPKKLAISHQHQHQRDGDEGYHQGPPNSGTGTPFLRTPNKHDDAAFSSPNIPTPTYTQSRFSMSHTGRLRAPIQPRFKLRGLRLENLQSPSIVTRLHFYIHPILVFSHLLVQTFLDINALFVLIQVTKFPDPSSIAPVSDRTWALATAAYVFCWFVQIFGIFLLYEVIYSFYRRWRTKRPLIAPLYLSHSARKFVSMTSYLHFCYFRRVRHSALKGDPRNKDENKWTDWIAESCYFYSQNLATVASLLPRAAICLALVFTFSIASSGGAMSSRDQTFFHATDGTLTGYGKGILIANAAWTAWRAVVVAGSFGGLWILSGNACGGLCGPRFRWNEEDERNERIQSIYLENAVETSSLASPDVDPLGWHWRERTLIRIREAWEFCLTHRHSHMSREQKLEEKMALARNKLTSPASTLPFSALEEAMASVNEGYPEPPTPARKRNERPLASAFFDSPARRPSPNDSSREEDDEEEEDDEKENVPFPEPQLADILPPSTTPSPAKDKGKRKDAPLMQLPYPFSGMGDLSAKAGPSMPVPAPTVASASASGVPFPSPVRGEFGQVPQQAKQEEEEELEEEFGDVEVDVDRGTVEYLSGSGGEAGEGGRTNSDTLSSLGRPLSPRSGQGQESSLLTGRSRLHDTMSSSEGGQFSRSSQSHSQSHSSDFDSRNNTRSSRNVPSFGSSPDYGNVIRYRTRTGSGMSGSGGEPQPGPELDTTYDTYEGASEGGHSHESGVTSERGDKVGLLTPALSHSSLAGMRRRSVSHNGSRSASGSSQSQSQGGSRSVSGTSRSSAGIRSRTHSLIQAVVPVLTGTRSRSHSAESASQAPGRSSEETNATGTGSSASNSNRDYTFGRPMPWQRRQRRRSEAERESQNQGQEEGSGGGVERAGTESPSSPHPASSGSSQWGHSHGRHSSDYTFGRPLSALVANEGEGGEASVPMPMPMPMPMPSIPSISTPSQSSVPTQPIPVPDDPSAQSQSQGQEHSDLSSAPTSLVTVQPPPTTTTEETGRSFATSTFTTTAFHPDPTHQRPV